MSDDQKPAPVSETARRAIASTALISDSSGHVVPALADSTQLFSSASAKPLTVWIRPATKVTVA